MIRSINKQQLVRERLARELLVLHLEGRDHLRPVQQYAESYGVGRGTVQSAFQELKDCGAIVLNACGARGTFLERVEQRKLFDACGYGELICLMPLNINRDYRGLATGIYETISAKDLPIHILFARGSRNRIKMLLRQKCDFVAISQLACEAAIERRGHTIEAVQALGSYPAELGVITRRGRDYVPGQTKVAFDRYSYDQCALHALLGMRPDERKDCLNVQLRTWCARAWWRRRCTTAAPCRRMENCNFTRWKCPRRRARNCTGRWWSSGTATSRCATC